MDIHKPKPWHGIREFLKEYVIIVVGVLTALGAEAVVQNLHERRLSAEARETVRAEIAADLGWMLRRREQEEACADRRLAEIALILQAAREGRSYATPAWIGRVTNQPISSRRWVAASQSGHLSLLPSNEQAAYGNAYFVIEGFAAMEEHEHSTWATLRSLEGLKTVPPAMLWGFTDALAQARIDIYRIKRTTDRALDDAKALGVRPTPTPRAAMDFKVAPICVPIDTSREIAANMIGTAVLQP
jgi:hypothetical protein